MDLDKLNLVTFGYGGLVLGSCQFLLLPQLPQKMILNSKVVKKDSKIIISLCWSKSVTHFVSYFSIWPYSTSVWLSFSMFSWNVIFLIEGEHINKRYDGNEMPLWLGLNKEGLWVRKAECETIDLLMFSLHFKTNLFAIFPTCCHFLLP